MNEPCKFISWSHVREGGNQCASSFKNTDEYSLYLSGRVTSVCSFVFANSVAMIVFRMLGKNSFPFFLNLFWIGNSHSPHIMFTKVLSGYSGFSLVYSFGRKL